MTDVTVLWTGLACIGAALIIVTLLAVRASAGPTGVARSLAAIEQMPLRGQVARQEAPFADRLLAPMWSALLTISRRLSPSGATARLQHQLDLAGNPGGWHPERVLAYKSLGLLSGLILGLILGGSTGAIGLLAWSTGLAAAGFFIPDLLVYNSGLKRQTQIRKSLPDALDMLTVSVEAGLGFDAALAQVARNAEGPIAGEFFRVLQEMQIGKSRNEAFMGLSERTTVDELKVFVSALAQADRLGVPIANVLREQSQEMRLKRRQRAEEMAQKVPIKILFPMVFCIFPALFVVIIGPGVINIIKAFSGNL
jgi:tight adherence protein C